MHSKIAQIMHTRAILRAATFLPSLTALSLAAVAPLSPAKATPKEDAAVIRSLRKASNLAIAAHDATGATAALAAEAVVLTSGGQRVEGAAAMRSAFSKVFADRQFVTYVREPRHVEIGGDLAAENGRWFGRWRDRVVSGRYLVRWYRTPNGWRIAAELYIPLRCTGRCGVPNP